jgi:5-methylcytosine-specific restriction endonuclease McrA
MTGHVLVLNQNYEPLNVCSWQRAVAMLCVGKAVALEYENRMLHSPTTQMRFPSVVRLSTQVRRPLPELKISRRAILARDKHTCQYCGHQSRTLTIDHIVPRERGGKNTWDNLVACCAKCNNEKGNKTPTEAGLALAMTVGKPRYIPYLSYPTFAIAARNRVWRDYLEPFAPHMMQGM